MNVYENCPALESERFLLRLVQKDDCKDLLKVYSDRQAIPLFNSDNCHGDLFDYQTEERMMQAIDFWIFSYQNRYFVRWTIIDKKTGEGIGTVELFAREALEGDGNTALLRLDLRSDYERLNEIKELLLLLRQPACRLFESDSVTTKAVPAAVERRKALDESGFRESDCLLTGDDGTQYGSYFVCDKHA